MKTSFIALCRAFLALGFLVSAQPVYGQNHPRLLFDATEGAALQARAGGQPYTAMLARVRDLTAQSGWALNNTKAVDFATLYYFQNNAADAEKAAHASLHSIAGPTIFDSSKMSISRGYELMHVALAYDLCANSAYYTNTVVPSSFVSFIDGVTYTVPAAYVGLTYKNAISLALKNGADLLVSHGGAGWPGDGSTGNNWFSLRYGGALLCYLATDTTYDSANFNTALTKLRSYLRDTLTQTDDARGWNPEGYGYNYFPARTTVLTALALQRSGGADLVAEYPALRYTSWSTLPGTLPVDFRFDDNWANGTLDEIARGIHPDVTDDNPQYIGEGVPYLALAMAHSSGGSGPAFDYRPGIRWMIDRYWGATANGGNNHWDFYRGAGLLGLLYYPDPADSNAPASVNPADVWGKTYSDPSYGATIMRNRYQDTKDIVFQTIANTRKNYGGHYGMDALAPRLIGLGVPWIVGPGRVVDAKGESTLLPSDPQGFASGTNGITAVGNRVHDSFLRTNGDGYLILKSELSDTGVETQTRRYLMDYSGVSGAAAVMVISDSSANGKFWRLQTHGDNTVTTGGNTFTVTAPGGQIMKGTVVSPASVTLRTGEFTRGSGWKTITGEVLTNKWVDFENTGTNGEFLVVLTLNDTGTTIPAVTGSLTSPGNWSVSVPGRTFSGAGDVLTVSGWNRPSVAITAPLDNANYNTGTTNVALSGTASDTAGGVIKTIEVYLDGTLKSSTAYNAASVNWNASVTSVPVGEHTLLVRTIDNDNDSRDAVVRVKVNNTVPPQDVAISSPGAADSFAPGANLLLQGTAYDPENALDRVEIWRDGVKLGNATYTLATKTWTYSIPSLATGLYTFEAIAYDTAGDYTSSGPLLARCSQTFSAINTWGDASQYFIGTGSTLASPALTTAAITSSPRWHVREFEGDLRLHTWVGPTYDALHALTFRGDTPKNYILRYKVKNVGASRPGYNISLTPTLNLQMRDVNAVWDTRTWVRWLTKGTCLWVAEPTGGYGYAGTVGFDTSVNGGTYTETSTHAGVLGTNWTDVEIRKLDKNLLVKVRPTGGGTYQTIMDVTDFAIGGSGRLSLVGRKLNDMGLNTEAYFDDIELVELDIAGNPLVNSATAVGFVSPATGSSLTGSVLNIAATVDDADGIASVEYFSGSRSLGTAALESGQWKLSWLYPPTGKHAIYARVTDNKGNVFTSASSVIDITSQGGPVTAVATGNPLSGTAPLPVTFSTAGSSSLQGSIVSYAWTFGDGATSTAASPSHTYATPGIYIANLTLTDSAGNQGYASVQISAAFPAGSNPVLIDDDFSVNTTADWEILSATTLGTAPTEAYSATGGTSNFNGVGVLQAKGYHNATSSTQSALQFKTLGAARNINSATLSTTGIHSDKGQVYLAVRYFDGGVLKWAVSGESIRTTYGSKSGGWAPVAGSWTLASRTWKALDTANLNAGGGATLLTSLVLTNADAAGFYSLSTGTWMTSGLGVVDSYTLANSITATAPAITQQPASLAVTAGDGATFSVAANGYPAPAYQWKKGGVNISGATFSTYNLTSTVPADAGIYTVDVSNSEGQVTSAAATLTVNVAPPPAVGDISESFPDSSVTALWQFIGSNSLGSNPPVESWRQNGVDSFIWTGGALGSTAWHSSTSSTQATLNYRPLSGVTNLTNSTFSTSGIHARNSTAKFAVRYVEGGITKWAVSVNSIRTTTGYSATGFAPVPGSWALSSFTWKAVDATNLSAGEGANVAAATVLQNANAVGVFGLFSGTWLNTKFPQISSFNLTGAAFEGTAPTTGPPLVFTLETSSWISGADTGAGVMGTIIQADGTVILAANLENAPLPAVPVTLLGSATASSQGAILRLAADGRTLIGITRVAASVHDLSADAAGNLYVAAGTDGALKLNATASALVWTRRAGQFVYRIDAGTDGTSALLIPGVTTAERDNKANAGTIVVIDPAGTEVSSFAGYGHTLDVTVDGATSTVVYCGWYNFNTYTGPYSKSYNGTTAVPVDIPYFRGVPYNYGQAGIPIKWMGHGWESNVWLDQANLIPNPRWVNAPFSTAASNLYTQAEVDALETSESRADGYYQYLLNNPKNFSNNMADTRAYRCAMGRDGKLYVGNETAGGNTPLRFKNNDLGTAVVWSEADGFFDQFFNTSTVYKLVIGRYEITPSAAVEQLVFGFTNRVTDSQRSSTDNTIYMRGGGLTADENGRVYITGGCNSGFYLPGNTLPTFDIPRFGEVAFDPFDPAGTLGEYTGGSYLMVMNNTATKRLYTSRLAGGGAASVDARATGSNAVTRLVMGGLVDNTIGTMGSTQTAMNKLHTSQAIQATRSAGSTSDGFFSVVTVTDPNYAATPVAPAITSQPTSLTVNHGAAASFTVIATGTPAPTYQWQKDGDNINGATASTLNITSTVSGDAGSYTVVVSNSVDSVTSAAAVLMVDQPAVTSPVDDTFPNTASISGWSFIGSNSLGSNPPTALWRLNGVNSFGWSQGNLGSIAWHSATSSTQATLNYKVLAAEADLSAATFATAGIHANSTAKLAVRYVEGGLTKWAVSTNSIRTTTGYSATGWAPVPGSWQLADFTWKSIDTANLAAGEGAEVNSATVLARADAVGVYGLFAGTWMKERFPQVVSFAITGAGSPPAEIGPSITQQPLSLTVTAGQGASFSVVATGLPAPTYQWHRNGTNISGATSATLTIASTSASDAGDYTVVVSNSAGQVTSNAATLTVNTAPVITQQPANLTVTAGNSASFTVIASGTPAPGYQWRKDGVDLAGQTAATLVLASVSPDDAGSYEVIVANMVDAVASSSAQLTVNVAPVITQQPASLAVTAGQSASFAVTATGTPAPTYQWRKNGNNIAGQTGSTLVLPATVSGDAGSYAVVVTNPADSVTSASATLTVNVILPPVITSATTAEALEMVAFSYSITATGSPTSFNAIGLPVGLTLDSQTGVISGTMARGTTGDYPVTISAANAGGTGSATLQMSVTESWVSQDIGNTSPAGSLSWSADGKTATILGAGADIFGTVDAFHYARVEGGLNGNGEILARVVSVDNKDYWTKAGVMMRETTAANSRFVYIIQRPDKMVQFGWRSNTGGSTTTVGATGGTTAVKFVRLVRTGNSFTAFYSTVSSTGPWIQIDTARTVTMAANVEVGLAVTSHKNGTLAAAVFDSISLMDN